MFFFIQISDFLFYSFILIWLRLQQFLASLSSKKDRGNSSGITTSAVGWGVAHPEFSSRVRGHNQSSLPTLKPYLQRRECHVYKTPMPFPPIPSCVSHNINVIRTVFAIHPLNDSPPKGSGCLQPLRPHPSLAAPRPGLFLHPRYVPRKTWNILIIV